MMKQLLFILGLFLSVAVTAQFAPTSTKTKFVNGIAIGSKDTSAFSSADSMVLTIARDSNMYFKAKGWFKQLATGGNFGLYLLLSDTLTMLSPYRTYFPRMALSFAAGSGAYNNTTGVITIPTNNSQLTNGSGYLSSVNLATNVTGILPIINGGIGSSTKNFVDLTTTQSIAGNKTFTGIVVSTGEFTLDVNGVTATDQYFLVNRVATTSTGRKGFRLDDNSTIGWLLYSGGNNTINGIAESVNTFWLRTTGGGSNEKWIFNSAGIGNLMGIDVSNNLITNYIPTKLNARFDMDGSAGASAGITMVFNSGINRLLTPLVRLYGSTNISSNYVELFGTNATQNRTVNFQDASGTVALTSQLASFTTIGSTPNANGASISSGVITLQPASASFGGVITTGTQTIAGAKTWSNMQSFNSTINGVFNGDYYSYQLKEDGTGNLGNGNISWTSGGILTAVGASVGSVTSFTKASQSTAGLYVGIFGSIAGSSLFVHTNSLNTTYGSGLAVYGTYSGGLSAINLYGVGTNLTGGASSMNILLDNNGITRTHVSFATDGATNFNGTVNGVYLGASVGFYSGNNYILPYHLGTSSISGWNIQSYSTAFSSLMFSTSNGTVRGGVTANASGVVAGMINASGSFSNYADASGNFWIIGTLTTSASDSRLKENVTIIPNALEKINSIGGYTFNWKQSNKEIGAPTDSSSQVGLIAQQIKSIMPQAVTLAGFDRVAGSQGFGVSKSGKDYLTVAYDKLVPLLIQAIKELDAKFEAYKLTHK